MKIKILLYVPLAALTTVIGLVETSAMAISIRQQNYTFSNDVTRDVSADTFVIGKERKSRQLPVPALDPFTGKKSWTLTIRTREQSNRNAPNSN